MIFGHESLHTFYDLNFKLMQFHGYSLDDIERMIPFEREVYLALLAKHLKDKREKK